METTPEHLNKITIGRVVEHLSIGRSIQGVIPRQDIQALINLAGELQAENSRLRERERQLVEALRVGLNEVAELIGQVQQTTDTVTMNQLQSEYGFIESLLNNQPNENT